MALCEVAEEVHGLCVTFLGLQVDHIALLAFAALDFRIAFQKVLPDTANPELVLFGGLRLRVRRPSLGGARCEAHDARDGNITEQIVVTGTMDMNTTGTYTLNYAVQDARVMVPPPHVRSR